MNFGDLPDAHVNHTLVPTLDDLSHSNGKRKGLLARVLGRPELEIEIAVLAISSAVDLWMSSSTVAAMRGGHTQQDQ